MHLSESIHFTPITAGSREDAAHFSQKDGALLSTEVSFLSQRLAGRETFYRHGQQLFHNKPVYLEQVGRPQFQQAIPHLLRGVEFTIHCSRGKGIFDVSSFPGSSAVTGKEEKQTKTKHGNLWLFGGAWEMLRRPRT